MKTSSGFTLVELLIALMISALAATLAFELLNMYRISSEKLVNNNRLQTSRFMSTVWIHQVIGCSTATNATDTIFQGNRKSIRGTSLCALYSKGGVPAGYQFDFSDNNSVYYKELSNAWQQHFSETQTDVPQHLGEVTNSILLNAQSSDLRLSYLGQDGSWNDRWPMGGVLSGNALPEAISIQNASEQLVLFIKLRGKKTPPLDVRNVL